MAKVADSGAISIESCSTSVLVCLTRHCHNLRLAAVGCLYQLCLAQSGLAASLLPSMLTTLDQAYRYVTSEEAIAATAATAAATFAGSLGKKDKLSQMFTISRSKSGVTVCPVTCKACVTPPLSRMLLLLLLLLLFLLWVFAEKVALHPHSSGPGLGIPGCGSSGGIGLCGSEDSSLLHRLHGF